jgi:hypothetical protein
VTKVHLSLQAKSDIQQPDREVQFVALSENKNTVKTFEAVPRVSEERFPRTATSDAIAAELRRRRQRLPTTGPFADSDDAPLRKSGKKGEDSADRQANRRASHHKNHLKT